MRVAFAFINFALAVFLAISCVIAVAAPESPFQLIGGLMFAAPVACYAFCEWLVLFRGNASVERRLAFANLAGGGFVAFGVIANVVEARRADEPPSAQFFFWFTLIGVTITSYLVVSSWYRLRWTGNS